MSKTKTQNQGCKPKKAQVIWFLGCRRHSRKSKDNWELAQHKPSMTNSPRPYTLNRDKDTAPQRCEIYYQMPASAWDIEACRAERPHATPAQQEVLSLPCRKCRDDAFVLGWCFFLPWTLWASSWTVVFPYVCRNTFRVPTALQRALRDLRSIHCCQLRYARFHLQNMSRCELNKPPSLPT